MSDMKMALKVFAKLPKRRLNEYDRALGAHHYNIYPYKNGRENGFAIINTNFTYPWNKCSTVVFAEHRSSSALAVYVGKYEDFDDNFIFKSEEKYKENRHYFEEDELEQAIEFIKEWIGL